MARPCIHPIWQICFAVFAAAPAHAATSVFKIGDPHPPLILRPIDGGEPVSLDAYRDNKVLVIYFATYSSQSRSMIGELREVTLEAVKDKKLVVLGVMLELHADRCRLFAQWKQLGFPILHDPLNIAGIERLPTLVGLDEQGFVQVIDPKPAELQEAFFENTESHRNEKARIPEVAPLDPKYTRRMASEARDAERWRQHGDALILAGEPEHIAEAITTYPQAIRLDPKDESAYFRLGVAHRIRYDSADRQAGDFQAAIDAWRMAVNCDPKNEVFRNHVSNYGLRHEKSASAYGWIENARKEIKERGDSPIELAVEPAPIELAQPRKKFKRFKSESARQTDETDAEADSKNLVEFEVIVVRALSKKRPNYAQILLVFRPVHGQWGENGSGLTVHLDPPAGVKLSRRDLAISNRPLNAADAPLVLDVEASFPKRAKEGMLIRGQSSYRLVEPTGDARVYRRDIEISIPAE